MVGAGIGIGGLSPVVLQGNVRGVTARYASRAEINNVFGGGSVSAEVAMINAAGTSWAPGSGNIDYTCAGVPTAWVTVSWMWKIKMHFNCHRREGS